MLTDKPIASKKDFSNDLDDSDEENPSLESPDPDASASPQETDKKKIPHPFAARMDYTKSSTLEEFLPKGTDRIHARGQIGEHAAAIMERQHRTHFFSVVTIGITVRFLRWDRAGVIVTKPIAFNKDLTRFVKFFYRFARLIPEQHGEDLSILKPEAEDLEALENFRINKAPNFVPNHQEFFRHAFFDHQKHYPIVKVHLDMLQSPPKISLDNRPEPSWQKTLRLLIGAPRTEAYSPFGRGTKGFIAFDLEEKRLKFVKDCWRYHGDGSFYHPELEVYERIQERVKLGPTVGLAIAEGGGDVIHPSGPDKVQDTVTDKYLNTLGKKKYLLQRHYRFAIRRVGTPLERYERTSRKLCRRVAEALSGHGIAWTQAEVLHRDVSPKNIMVDEDPEGELDSGPSQGVRSGTWPFISSLLLYSPAKQHELSDDLESFVHVIHWFCLRFHSHDLTGSPTRIASRLSSVYLACSKINDYDVGGEEKLTCMKTGKPCFTLQETSVNEGLRLLVDKLSELCKEHYATVDFQALEAARNEILNLQPREFTPLSTTQPVPEEVEDEMDSEILLWGAPTPPQSTFIRRRLQIPLPITLFRQQGPQNLQKLQIRFLPSPHITS
ncbi:hypothetical protein C8Q75DRAFT_811974 [Abortiporus biennis]|nr:hypothetical protein C8Q75DRAFT_811974 [Abortiporus biennis]